MKRATNQTHTLRAYLCKEIQKHQPKPMKTKPKSKAKKKVIPKSDPAQPSVWTLFFSPLKITTAEPKPEPVQATEQKQPSESKTVPVKRKKPPTKKATPKKRAAKKAKFIVPPGEAVVLPRKRRYMRKSYKDAGRKLKAPMRLPKNYSPPILVSKVARKGSFFKVTAENT